MNINLELHPYKPAPPLFVRKSLPDLVREAKDLTLSQTIHNIEVEIIKSEMKPCEFSLQMDYVFTFLIGEKKAALSEVSSKRSSIRYLQSKVKASEFNSYSISDIAAIVSNPYTGPVSLKDGVDDDGPTVHIVMLSKKLIQYANDADMVYIDGVFKVVSNLQIVLLGVHSPSLENHFSFFSFFHPEFLSSSEWNKFSFDILSPIGRQNKIIENGSHIFKKKEWISPNKI